MFLAWKMVWEQSMAVTIFAGEPDPTLLYCADGYCPVFVNTIPKTRDGVHMTVNYGTYIAPAMKELFETNKLLP